MLLVVEGNRRAGKSFLINSQKVFPTFKFEFNEAFSGLNLKRDSPDTHYLGLGKELMLHQLNRDGFLKEQFPIGWMRSTPCFVVDRGIISNTVWGVFQNRITLREAEEQIRWIVKSGLLLDSYFVAIEGTSTQERRKDIWDGDDSRVQEEIDLFNHFYNLMDRMGYKVNRFKNNFDKVSEDNFTNFLKELETRITCVEY